MRLQRKNLRILQTVSFGAFVVLVFFLLIKRVIFSEEGIRVIRTLQNVHFKQKPEKKILFWLPHINKDIVTFENHCLKKCPIKCIVTGDKTNIAEMDANNFHLSNLWTEIWSIGTRSIIEFLKYRRPDQVWIVSNKEPPQHLWGDLRVFNGIFNWTQWYRFDSDVPWPYGFPYKLNKTEKAEAVKEFTGKNYFGQKTKDIIGRVSNCIAPNRRIETIKRIMRYMKIDMQGVCFKNPCGKPGDHNDKECDRSLQDYKFFLAFENNDCVDYVTEKYWNSLKRDQIPIVNWKSINRKIVIPGSYINIYGFPDLQTAMEYVKKVSLDESLYNSYFDWRTSYADRRKCTSCEICKRLHDKDLPAQVIKDLDAWVRNDRCEKAGSKEKVRST